MSIESPQERELPIARAPAQDVNRQSNVLLWIVTLLSLTIACCALAFSIYRDPLGSSINKYDFSTPKAALESQIKIELNRDIRAMMEMGNVVDGKKKREKLETLEVRKEVEFRGKKVLFISFKVDGVWKYTTETFEKDANTGYWISTDPFGSEYAGANNPLVMEMRRWSESGELDTKK